MEKVLTSCPLCGSDLNYNELMQATDIYPITKRGKVSARRMKRRFEGSMGTGFINCSNENCKFVTDCDLEVEKNIVDIDIWQQNGKFMYELGE